MKAQLFPTACKSLAAKQMSPLSSANQYKAKEHHQVRLVFLVVEVKLTVEVAEEGEGEEDKEVMEVNELLVVEAGEVDKWVEVEDEDEDVDVDVGGEAVVQAEETTSMYQGCHISLRVTSIVIFRPPLTNSSQMP